MRSRGSDVTRCRFNADRFRYCPQALCCNLLHGLEASLICLHQDVSTALPPGMELRRPGHMATICPIEVRPLDRLQGDMGSSGCETGPASGAGQGRPLLHLPFPPLPRSVVATG